MSDRIKNLEALNNGVRAIKDGLEKREAKIEEIEARIDNLDESLRGAGQKKEAPVADCKFKRGMDEFARDLTTTDSANLTSVPLAVPVDIFAESANVASKFQVHQTENSKHRFPVRSAQPSAAFTTEGGSITESDSSWTDATVTLEAVKSMTQITAEALAEAPGLANDALNELQKACLRKVEIDMLASTSGSAALESLNQTSGATIVRTTGDDVVIDQGDMEAMLKAMPVEALSNMSDLIYIMSPSLNTDLALTRDSAGVPIMSSQYNQFGMATAPSFAGIPVVVSPFMPAYEIDKGNDEQIALLVNKKAINVALSPLTVRSSTDYAFQNDLLSVAAGIRFAHKVALASHVVVLRTALA